MIPGLGEDIRCHVYSFLRLQITRAVIRPQVKLAVNLVIEDGHFNLPQGLCGYVWVNTLTFVTPEGFAHFDSFDAEHTSTLHVCEKYERD